MKIRFLKSTPVLIALLAVCFNTIAVADTTITQTVSRVQYDGGSDSTYVIGPAKWGSPACPNATYVQIKPSVVGKDRLHADVLAAFVAGKTVSFWGTCDTNTEYFNATYIVIQ